jgi:hypothetical protein
MECLLDLAGAVLWYTTFLTPLITIPLIWKLFKIHWIYRILIGLFFAGFLSFFFYHISLGLIFRHGMGPG